MPNKFDDGRPKPYNTVSKYCRNDRVVDLLPRSKIEPSCCIAPSVVSYLKQIAVAVTLIPAGIFCRNDSNHMVTNTVMIVIKNLVSMRQPKFPNPVL